MRPKQLEQKEAVVQILSLSNIDFIETTWFATELLCNEYVHSWMYVAAKLESVIPELSCSSSCFVTAPLLPSHATQATRIEYFSRLKALFNKIW